MNRPLRNPVFVTSVAFLGGMLAVAVTGVLTLL